MLVPKNATRLKIGNLLGYVPESWNDLPREKLLGIMAIILISAQETKLDAAAMIAYQRINILAVLMNTDLDLLLDELGLGAAAGAMSVEEAEEANDNLLQLLDTITFCYEPASEDEPEQLRIRMGLTRCPYPQLKDDRGFTLYAPKDELENLTIYELATVLTLMDAYTREKSDDVLHDLLATIYRPGKRATPDNLAADFHGDRREPLYRADHLVPARARHWRKVPHIVKQTLWFWLASCRQAIVGNPAFAILFEAGTGGKEDPFGWAGTLLHLADNKVMHMDAAATAPYASALLQLAREKHQAQEEEMKAKRRRIR